MDLKRASLRPPVITEDAPADDTRKLANLARTNGFGISGGPSGQPDRAGEGDRSEVLAPMSKLSLRDRRPHKETRSMNFNCKMKPSIKDKLDEICISQGLSQGDVLEMLIKAYDLKQ